MKPSIGRIVHFYQINEPVVPAIITQVWDDEHVNLRVFQDNAYTPELHISVALAESGGGAMQKWWCWPPRVE